MRDLLMNTGVQVSDVGELVTMRVGNAGFTFEFPTALKLATWIKWNSRIAKIQSGNTRSGFHVMGLLVDANARAPKRKRFQETLPELLKVQGMTVGTEGQRVVITIGSTTIKLPYDEARTISQWLRLHGKRAKATAGEHEHWSNIAQARSIEHGERPH